MIFRKKVQETNKTDQRISFNTLLELILLPYEDSRMRLKESQIIPWICGFKIIRRSTFVNKHSQDIYEKVQSKKAEALAQGVSSYDENLGFREVYGPPKSGKVIGYGRGIRPSMVFRSFKSQASEALKRDNEELKEKVKLLTSEVGEMKEFLLALTGMQTHQNDEVQVQANGEDDSDAESLDEMEEN